MSYRVDGKDPLRTEHTTPVRIPLPHSLPIGMGRDVRFSSQLYLDFATFLVIELMERIRYEPNAPPPALGAGTGAGEL